MKNISYALLNMKKNFKNAKELKSSFIISVVGMCFNNIAFLVLWYYFGKTVGEINGWKPMDIFGLYGFGTTSFGIISSFFYGIFNIPSYISSGNFDKYLYTPKNILLKISTSAISTSALGDMLFGIICFVVFAIYRKLSLVMILLSFFLMILSSVIFYSFVLICMSISFYVMDGQNVSQGFYELFLNNTLYHGGAYTGILRIIFIYLIPSLLMAAIPVEIVINFSINNLLLITIGTIFWFIISILFFYKSLKKYESNNLFGFGN